MQSSVNGIVRLGKRSSRQPKNAALTMDAWYTTFERIKHDRDLLLKLINDVMTAGGLTNSAKNALNTVSQFLDTVDEALAASNVIGSSDTESKNIVVGTLQTGAQAVSAARTLIDRSVHIFDLTLDFYKNVKKAVNPIKPDSLDIVEQIRHAAASPVTAAQNAASDAIAFYDVMKAKYPTIETSTSDAQFAVAYSDSSAGYIAQTINGLSPDQVVQCNRINGESGNNLPVQGPDYLGYAYDANRYRWVFNGLGFNETENGITASGALLGRGPGDVIEVFKLPEGHYRVYLNRAIPVAGAGNRPTHWTGADGDVFFATTDTATGYQGVPADDANAELDLTKFIVTGDDCCGYVIYNAVAGTTLDLVFGPNTPAAAGAFSGAVVLVPMGGESLTCRLVDTIKENTRVPPHVSVTGLNQLIVGISLLELIDEFLATMDAFFDKHAGYYGSTWSMLNRQNVIVVAYPQAAKGSAPFSTYWGRLIFTPAFWWSATLGTSTSPSLSFSAKRNLYPYFHATLLHYSRAVASSVDIEDMQSMPFGSHANE